MSVPWTSPAFVLLHAPHASWLGLRGAETKMQHSGCIALSMRCRIRTKRVRQFDAGERIICDWRKDTSAPRSMKPKKKADFRNKGLLTIVGNTSLQVTTTQEFSVRISCPLLKLLLLPYAVLSKLLFPSISPLKGRAPDTGKACTHWKTGGHPVTLVIQSSSPSLKWNGCSTTGPLLRQRSQTSDKIISSIILIPLTCTISQT